MHQLKKFLKDKGESLLAYQKTTNRNMFLCAFGFEGKDELNKIGKLGFSKIIAYFPVEKMPMEEVHLIINNKDALSYSIAGITLIHDKMYYFATTRICLGQWFVPQQQQYDHLYYNAPISVFETEQHFVKFLCKSHDFPNDGLYTLIKENVESALALAKDLPKSVDTMQCTITSEGILDISPAASLASQMVE